MRGASWQDEICRCFRGYRGVCGVKRGVIAAADPCDLDSLHIREFCLCSMLLLDGGGSRTKVCFRFGQVRVVFALCVCVCWCGMVIRIYPVRYFLC